MHQPILPLCFCCDSELDGIYIHDEWEIVNFAHKYHHTTQNLQIWKESIPFMDGPYSNDMRWIIGDPNSNLISTHWILYCFFVNSPSVLQKMNKNWGQLDKIHFNIQTLDLL
jgi:hypothetical protein